VASAAAGTRRAARVGAEKSGKGLKFYMMFARTAGRNDIVRTTALSCCHGRSRRETTVYGGHTELTDDFVTLLSNT